jgi:hypothetical protein
MASKYQDPQFVQWLKDNGWDDKSISGALSSLSLPFSTAAASKLLAAYDGWQRAKTVTPTVHVNSTDPNAASKYNTATDPFTGVKTATPAPPSTTPTFGPRGPSNPHRARQTNTPSTGLFGEPGVGEKTGQAVLDKLPDAGNKLATFWSGQQDKVLNPPKPQKAADMWGGPAGAWFSAPTSPGAANAYNISDKLQNPTSWEKNLRQVGDSFNAPTDVENYVKGVANYFTTQSQGEKNASTALGELATTGAMEQAYPGIMDAISRINYGQQAIGDVRKELEGAGNAQAFLDRNRGMTTTAAAPIPAQAFNQWLQTSGQWYGPSGESMPEKYQRFLKETGYGKSTTTQTEPGWFDQNIALDEYNKYFAPLTRNQSYSEQLYSGGEGGRAIDTYYDRNQQKAEKDLNRQLAARGIFNSGRALRSNEELGADVAAAKAQQLQSLAGQADASMIARTGAAREFMGTAAEETIGRKGIEATASGLADTAAVNRAGKLTDVFGMASDEALGKTAQQTSASSAAQKARDERLSGVATGNLALSNTERERIEGGGRMADLSSNTYLNRRKAQADVYGKGADIELDRYKTSADAGTSADNAQTARFSAGLQAAFGLDDQEFKSFSAYLQGVGISIQALSSMDRQEIEKLVTQWQVASGVQGLFEGRNLTKLNINKGAAETLFNASQGETGKALEEAFGITLKDIEAGIAAGGVKGQQMKDDLDLATKLIDLGVKGTLLKNILAMPADKKTSTLNSLLALKG